MFTGIIEERGTVTAVAPSGDGVRLTVQGPLVVSDPHQGDSIAVSGVCLTVVDQGEDWFTADVYLLPEARDAKGDLPVGALPARVSSIAFGYSPGGPITNLCEYKVVQPTFRHDIMRVPDPLTRWDHVFFGGNYPAMYRVRLPLVNDTTAPVTLNFHLASNDRFGVHSTAGVWLEGRLHRAVTPAIVRGDRWRVWSVRLAPGQRHAVDMTVVALGGLWGGFVGSLSVD